MIIIIKLYTSSTGGSKQNAIILLKVGRAYLGNCSTKFPLHQAYSVSVHIWFLSGWRLRCVLRTTWPSRVY